jgi:hypothetical protein
MPDEIVAALGRVASALPTVDWPQPDQLRARAEAGRRRRVVAATFVAVLLIGGGIGLARFVGAPAAWSPVGPGRSATSTPKPSCSDGSVPVNIKVPEYKDIRVNVYNGTQEEGLAAMVAEQLRNRGLNVYVVDNVPEDQRTEEVAIIRYGPDAVGAAWVLRSFFLDRARTTFDPHWETDTVDIILGSGFQHLGSVAEVNRGIANLGRPVPPPGTCAA